MLKYFFYLTAFVGFVSINSSAQRLSIPFNDKHISYQGRIVYKKKSAELIWPGTSVKINFTGTGIAGRFKDSDTSNYYNIIIDKDSIYKIHFDTSEKTYPLVSGLRYGKHSIEIFKRTEWDKGKTWFYGFEFNEKATLLNPSARPKRKIEFYGNSITCGYAIEDSINDSPIGYYENNYDAYAAITARHFNAQYYCIAKSGIGVMVSWFPLIMPEMYDRADPEDSDSKWNFAQYTPDLVVINLFQNDSWILNMPGNEQFKKRFGSKAPGEDYIINAYKNFVQCIRKKYPEAHIICMLGNMDITKKDSPWPGYVQRAVSLLKDKKMYTFFIPYKETPGHPKTKEQKALAQDLIQFISAHIKW